MVQDPREDGATQGAPTPGLRKASVTLRVLEGSYAIARLAPDAAIPDWADGPGFVSITRTTEELSILCLADRVPQIIRSDAGWCGFHFAGPFAFDETGEIVGAGHASATGRFDDEQLFYLRSRGIPEDAARRLVVRGFFEAAPDGSVSTLNYADGTPAGVAGDSRTVAGGAGPDIFHTFGDAGIDRVIDFNRAEGDRVQIDAGRDYTVTQAGADVVIRIEGDGEMTLVGVDVATLTGDWIFTL